MSLSVVKFDSPNSVHAIRFPEDECEIVTYSGTLRLFHSQDCCENVCCTNDETELRDALTGRPLVSVTRDIYADETPLSIPPLAVKACNPHDSFTWTIFHCELHGGEVVDVVFYGESNGYYCETADMVLLKADS